MGSLAAASAEPLTLAAALALAEQSPQVRLAEGQLEQARHRLAVAASPVSLELTAGYRLTRGVQHAPSLEAPRRLDENRFDPFAVTASLNVIPYGPAFEGRVRAEWEVWRAEWRLRDARADALVVATERFLAAVRASERLGSSAFEVELAALALAAVKTRFEAGSASEAEVWQAEVQLERAENTYAAAKRDEASARAALALALGAEVGELAPPEELRVALPPINVEEALAQRSDVLFARLALSEAELAVAAAWREGLPVGTVRLEHALHEGERRLGVAASLDTRSWQPVVSAQFHPDAGPLPGAPEDARSQSFALSLQLRIPLDAARSSASSAAMLALEHAQLEIERALELARIEVQSRLSELEARDLDAELSARVASQRERLLAATEERHALGLVSVLELRQAERDALAAALALAEARDAQLVAAMRLARALGLSPLEVF
jgi:outer membrane protein TolC